MRAPRLHEALSLCGIHLVECIHRLKGLLLFWLNLVAAELKKKKKKAEFGVSCSSRKNKSLPGGICQVWDRDRSLKILCESHVLNTFAGWGRPLWFGAPEEG